MKLHSLVLLRLLQQPFWIKGGKCNRKVTICQMVLLLISSLVGVKSGLRDAHKTAILYITKVPCKILNNHHSHRLHRRPGQKNCWNHNQQCVSVITLLTCTLQKYFSQEQIHLKFVHSQHRFDSTKPSRQPTANF